MAERWTYVADHRTAPRPPAADAGGDHAHARRARRPPVAPRPVVHDQVRQRRELLGDLRRLRRAAPRRPRHRPLDPSRSDDRRHRRGAPARAGRPGPRRCLCAGLDDDPDAAGRRRAGPDAVHDLGRLRRPHPPGPGRLDRHAAAAERRHRPRARARHPGRLARPQRHGRRRHGRRPAAPPPGRRQGAGALVRVDPGGHLRRRRVEQLRQRRLPLGRAPVLAGGQPALPSLPRRRPRRHVATAAPPSGPAT